MRSFIFRNSALYSLPTQSTSLIRIMVVFMGIDKPSGQVKQRYHTQTKETGSTAERTLNKRLMTY